MFKVSNGTLDKYTEYVQSNNKDTRMTSSMIHSYKKKSTENQLIGFYMNKRFTILFTFASLLTS